MAENTRTLLQGISVSSGVGMGEVYVLPEPKSLAERREFTSEEEEIRRLKQSIDGFCTRTYEMFQEMRSLLGQEDALILGGQIFMARDLEFVEELHQEIRQGHTAEEAVLQVFGTYLSYFTEMDDVVMAQRGADLVDMRDSILSLLAGEQAYHLDVTHGVVICARGMTPSLMAIMANQQVAAILCEEGGSTSHCAILARSAGIPAVFGVERLLERVTPGEMMVVDGVEGNAICNPSFATQERYREKARWYNATRQELERFRGVATQNALGDKIELMTNVNDLGQIHRSVELGADGVGLFRTEFLYMESEELPSELLQMTTYRRAAMMMEGKPVVLRTLDIGGDKQAKCLPTHLEENPFLGLRGVRYCLTHQDIFRTQLRAILRAGAEHPNISILIPFISQVEEIYQVKKLLEDCRAELQAEGLPVAQHLKFGVMVETPAAAVMMDIILPLVDFISVGTNDLVQYIGVADRGNPKVGEHYAPYQISVLRLLKHIIGLCHKHQVPVTVCGEMAGDPRIIPVLLSFGSPGFSVAPSGLLSVRRELAGWTHQEAKNLVSPVMRMQSSREIQHYLEEIIHRREGEKQAQADAREGFSQGTSRQEADSVEPQAVPVGR